MTTLQNLGLAFGLIFDALWSIASGVYAHSGPAIDAMVVSGIAYLVRRFIRNRAMAQVIQDAASAAYVNMASQFAAKSPPGFAQAKAIAVSAAIASLDAGAKSALAHVEPDKVVTSVQAEFGRLLAADPSFSVTDPHGVRAAPAPTVVNVPIPQVPVPQVPVPQLPLVVPGVVSGFQTGGFGPVVSNGYPPVGSSTAAARHFDLGAVLSNGTISTEAVKLAADAALASGLAKPAA